MSVPQGGLEYIANNGGVRYRMPDSRCGLPQFVTASWPCKSCRSEIHKHFPIDSETVPTTVAASAQREACWLCTLADQPDAEDQIQQSVEAQLNAQNLWRHVLATTYELPEVAHGTLADFQAHGYPVIAVPAREADIMHGYVQRANVRDSLQSYVVAVAAHKLRNRARQTVLSALDSYYIYRQPEVLGLQLEPIPFIALPAPLPVNLLRLRLNELRDHRYLLATQPQQSTIDLVTALQPRRARRASIKK